MNKHRFAALNSQLVKFVNFIIRLTVTTTQIIEKQKVMLLLVLSTNSNYLLISCG